MERTQQTIDEQIHAYLLKKRRRMLNRQEAFALGGDDDLIETRLRQGHWRQLHPGVYLVGAGPLTWHEHALAAWLAAPEPAGLSHRAGLLWWGMSGIERSPVELSVRHGTHSHIDGAIVHRTRCSEGFVMRNGAMVTSVERTLAEAALYVPQVVIDQAFCSAWRNRLTSPEKALLYVDRYGTPFRRGMKVLAAVAGHYADGHRPPGSEAEVDELLLIDPYLAKAGIERPVRQLEVPLPDGTSATLDTAWPDRRKAVEPRGGSAHGNLRAQAYDYEREALLREVRWEVMPVAPYSLRHRPKQTALSIIRFLKAPSLPPLDAPAPRSRWGHPSDLSPGE